MMDTIRYFFGDVDRVYGEVRLLEERFIDHPERGRIVSDSEDTFVAVITFKSGLVGTWSYSDSAAVTQLRQRSVLRQRGCDPRLRAGARIPSVQQRRWQRGEGRRRQVHHPRAAGDVPSQPGRRREGAAIPVRDLAHVSTRTASRWRCTTSSMPSGMEGRRKPTGGPDSRPRPSRSPSTSPPTQASP